MKFSENWLRDVVALTAGRDELVRRLTMAGLEVESVDVVGEGLANVVVAEILEAQPHPNAAKLRVCRVDAGGEALTIVCGAPNARAGLRAPLARIGARLPGGIEIAAAELRGVASQGMLCAADELGLPGGGEGLLELPVDAPVGTPLVDYLGLPDASIELKMTPNRADCLGLRGLASEVATLFDTRVTMAAPAAVPAVCDAVVPVRIDAPADCPRYLGRVLRGIDARRPTPRWMVDRLERAGLRSISAVVDCTNYVMLELGQPMHAFDLARIDGGIIVRRAVAGESLVLLDEREVALTPEFLVIADATRALAVAGVMGGHGSRVTDATIDLFLESAHFAPPAIIGRARKLGLHTDASHRFERGVDPALPALAMERLTALLVDIVGGTPGPVQGAESAAHLPVQAPIALRAARLATMLGMDIPDDRVAAILRGLDMQVTPTADGWSVMPPTRRFDIAIEADLIEEVVRVHGYDAVPVRAPGGMIRLVADSESRLDAADLAAALAARGYSEALNFAFVGANLLEPWGMAEGQVTLANPLSADLAVMRPALLPGLVAALQRNLARQQSRVRLFEIGRVFAAAGETDRIAAVAIGTARTESWGEPRRALDFFDAKGDLEQLLALGGRAAEWVPSQADWLHPGRAAALVIDGVVVGHVGALHPRLARALDLPGDVYAFECRLDALTARGLPRAAELSRQPAVRRDLAVVVADAVAWSRIRAIVAEAAGVLLRELVLFDEYRGKGLPDGHRSLAMGLILQDDSRTLVDEDADRVVASVVAALARDADAVLRA
jgi:phenylalanyl-tRNA synthetase beta chain